MLIENGTKNYGININAAHYYLYGRLAHRFHVGAISDVTSLIPGRAKCGKLYFLTCFSNSSLLYQALLYVVPTLFSLSVTQVLIKGI